MGVHSKAASAPLTFGTRHTTSDVPSDKMDCPQVGVDREKSEEQNGPSQTPHWLPTSGKDPAPYWKPDWGPCQSAP